MARPPNIVDVLQSSPPLGNDPPSVNDDKSYPEKHDPETAFVEPQIDDLVLHDERDIATHVISVSDDPSLNPWTFRAFLLGIGLSAFGGVLGA